MKFWFEHSDAGIADALGEMELPSLVHIGLFVEALEDHDMFPEGYDVIAETKTGFRVMYVGDNSWEDAE
jgi:hypothetical protein